MRTLAIFALCMLSSCATYPSQDFATLRFNDPPKMDIAGGILAIGRVQNDEGARQVRVKPGRRTVSYNCPGTLSMDGAPSIKTYFKPRTQYDLVCAGPSAEIVERQ